MKKLKIYAILGLLSMLFMATSCPEDDEFETANIIIENQSDELIYIAELRNSRDKYVLLNVNFAMHNNLFSKIASNHMYDSFFILYNGHAMYQLLIIKESTLNKFSKEELISNNIYDKLYVLSDEELKAMNYKITYTGE